MAAMVSALLESAETHIAERLEAPTRSASLVQLGPEALDIWQTGQRGALAIRLQPMLERGWLTGRCMMSGRSVPVPFDLVSLDFTTVPNPDSHATSSGLASGNTVQEAAVAAVAELLERDLTDLFASASAKERRAMEIDVESIAAPFVRYLVNRIHGAGSHVRLWSMGQQIGIAAIRCAIVARGQQAALPPTIGSGCHPDRNIAALRAILEAVQVHATLIAGARDDLRQTDYDNPDSAKLELMLSNLCFGPGMLEWLKVPDSPAADPGQALDHLLFIAQGRSSLPVVGIEHDSGVPGIAMFRAIAPGLFDSARVGQLPVVEISPPCSISCRGPPVVFIGPTLGEATIPEGIEQRPPAVCGDLARLLASPPRSVGLVDGCFGTQPSVWHKEILALIAAGIPVFGAASIGALRAAELADFGMIGVGLVFQAYRNGQVRRDDAVMLDHAPAEFGWQALTITLVDAEEALRAVPMENGDRRMLQRIVRTMPFAVRTWEKCLTEFTSRTGRPPPATCETLASQPSIKLQDAMLMMQMLADDAAMPSAPPQRHVPPTSGYFRVLAEIS